MGLGEVSEAELQKVFMMLVRCILYGGRILTAAYEKRVLVARASCVSFLLKLSNQLEESALEVEFWVEELSLRLTKVIKMTSL